MYTIPYFRSVFSRVDSRFRSCFSVDSASPVSGVNPYTSVPTCTGNGHTALI